MKTKVILTFAFLLYLLPLTGISAHPGSGIVVDEYGQVYFTDTGKGVWKIDTQGKSTFIPASAFHWLTMDANGYFTESPQSFGNYFERVTPKSARPTLIQCSDFPVVVNKDGNLYYTDTRPNSTKIIRRTPDGQESVVAINKLLGFINGIAASRDGSLYITEASNPTANTIQKIRLDRSVSILANFVGRGGKNLPLKTEPSYCRGLAVDSTGTIYVAATGSRSVLKVTPQGIITTILQETSPWTPTGVAVFHSKVYVLEWHDVAPALQEVRSAWIPRVRKIRKDGRITTLATVSR